MPVTSSMKQKRESVPDYSSVMGLGHINTTSFLFGDDEERNHGHKESATSPDVKSYLQMNTTDDKFPILIRNNHQPGLVSSFIRCHKLALIHSCSFPHPLQLWILLFRSLPAQKAVPTGGHHLPVTAHRNIACLRMS